ncbi:DNA-3-methyladenine glycosylase [Gryllotalpicola protaetiae]|uniref:Putative 3-methyladenine DNA glycosylase n=1 Tax=Gryllotalpicola protaetiae TaxID=2419771 RepID=A0A387BPC9_9MICO|nr:DNA-3-methyladenine glycosylase [Gryllotalpicola protaetiae]AYG04568.1 DNA-3-methyladenine glycosylase [Gryllotalpicola protaetiae]
MPVDARFTPDREFFARPATEIAPLLLGARLTHETDAGAVVLRLTEVEAYLGDGADPGSHAFRGRTKRNGVMYGEPGFVYVYFTYGMHVCANLVCSPPGAATAVLLRAAEVVEGTQLAEVRRGAVPARDLARGPARLTVAAGIRLDENGADALSAPFALELEARPPAFVSGPRVGVSGDGGGEAFPWRFWIAGDPTVSVYRPAKPRATRPGARVPRTAPPTPG